MIYRKEEEDNFSLDLTPMIDVVFLLLIFFMVSTSFVDFSSRMDISLPEAAPSATPDKLKNHVIEITLDKTIFLDGTQMDIDSLLDKLKETEDEPDMKKSVIIRADKKLDYGLVVKVMGIVNTANITNLSIAVK